LNAPLFTRALRDGGEVDDVEEINPDDVLYISQGEDFIPLLSQGPPPPPVATTSHTTATTAAATTTSLPFTASATPISTEQKENKKRVYDDDEAEMEEEEQAEVPQATATTTTTTTTIPSSGFTGPPTRSLSSSSSSSSSSSLGPSASAAFAQATRKVTVTGSVGKLSPAEEERYHKCLKTYFGYSSFRPLQVSHVSCGRVCVVCGVSRVSQ
jgi:hypothetical protein